MSGGFREAKPTIFGGLVGFALALPTLRKNHLNQILRKNHLNQILKCL